MIMQVEKSISLEESMQKDLLEAKEQVEEIDQVLLLDTAVLATPFVLKAVKDTLKRNKELLTRIAETGAAIEYWKKYPEQYAKIRKQIEEDEKVRFPDGTVELLATEPKSD